MAAIQFVGHGGNVIGSLSSGSLVQNMPTSIEFNGTTTHASSSANYTQLDGVAQFTTTWWQQRATNQNGRVFNIKASSGELMYARFDGSGDAADLEFFLNAATDGFIGAGTAADFAKDGTDWQHYAITYRGNELTMYRNGVEIADDSTPTGVLATSGGPLYVGSYHSGATPRDPHFDGSLRDFRIFTSGLTATEVADVFADVGMKGTGITPVGWYHMEDGTGNTLNDSGSANIDLGIVSGSWNKSKYHLYQVGSGSIGDDDSKITAHVSGGTWDLRDKTTYLDFNGTASYTDLGASVTTFDGATQGTVSAWVKLDSVGSARAILTRYDSTDSNRQFNFNITATNKAKFIVQNDKSSYNGDHDVEGTTSLVAGEWNHIVGTFSTTNGQKIYVNGQFDGIASTTIEDALDTVSQNTYIGKLEQGGTSSNYFDGIIKDVGMYDTELTPTQIKLLYEGKWVGNPAHLWKLNEGTGNGEDSGQGSTTAQTQSTTWVNPSYGITSSGSGDSDNILYLVSGNTLSAPRGELVCRAIKNTPNWTLEGKYIHNSGTFEFKNATTNDWYPANKADNTNTFYKVKQNGTKPQWHKGNWTIEHSLNLQANIRSYANSSHTEGYILTLGTTGSVGYISGSAYIQAMTNTNGGSLVKSASENYPAILSGTHSDYGSTLGLYRSIQVSGVHIYGTMKTGNNAFENGSKLTILGNTKWFDKTGGGAEIKIPLTDSASNDTRQTLDVSGASVHIKIPVYMSGAAIVKDAALYVNKFPKPSNDSWTHNTNTKIIYQHQTAHNDTWWGPSIYLGKQMYNNRYRAKTDGSINLGSDFIVGTTGDTDFQIGADGATGGSINFRVHNFAISDDMSSDTVFDQAGQNLYISGTQVNQTGGLIGSAQGVFDNNPASTPTDYILYASGQSFGATATIEAWVRTEDTGDQIFLKLHDPYTYLKVDDDGKIKGRIGTNGITTELSSTTLCDDGRWHNVALVYGGNGVGSFLYIDGVLEAFNAGDTGGGVYTPNTFSIGADYIDNQKGLKGSLGRVSVWNDALTQREILDMMFMTYPEVSSSAIDHTKCFNWTQFDGNTASTTVYNLASGSNDGTASTTDIWQIPNGYGNWQGSYNVATGAIYLTSALDIEFNAYNLRLGMVSGGATADKTMELTRYNGEQAIQFYGALYWGPGKINQENSPTRGRNSTPWTTCNGNATWMATAHYPRYVPLGGDSSVPFASMISYWNSSGSTEEMTIKTLLPTDNINLGGDVTITNQMQPSMTDITKRIKTHGYDIITPQWYNYNNTKAAVQLDAGSTLYFKNNNNGFVKGGDVTLLQVHASGQSCAVFNQYSRSDGVLNNSTEYNYIDTNASIVGTGSPAAFTVSFWYKSPTDLASYSDTLTTAIGFNGSSEGGISLVGTNWLVLCQGSVYRYFNSAPNTDGLWHHMLVYVDPANASNIRMWIDGSEESAGSTATGGTTNWSGHVHFGWGDYGAMPVSLSDIRFYNAANTPTGSVALLASHNPATSVSGAYADPTNTLSAYAWFKLDDNLGLLSVADSIGTYTSAALGKVGSGPNARSGVSRIMPSGTTTNWDFNEGVGDRILHNFYSSGSQDIMVGASGTANGDGTYYPGGLITKGRVRFD